MNQPKRKEFLSFAEKLRVVDWVKENIDRIKAERPNRIELAKQASAGLTDPDIHINANHLRTVLDAMGVELDSRRSTGTGTTRRNGERIESLERKVATLSKLRGVGFSADGGTYTETNGRRS